MREEELVDQYGPRIMERARNIILFQLSSAPKTRKQLFDKLLSKEIPEEIINYLLDRYEELHLINDEVFAEMWVASRHRSKGLGKRNLKQELKLKGVSDEYIEAALESLSDEQEYSKATQLCENKYRRMPASLSPEKKKQRLIGFLVRKGYSPNIVYSIVNSVIDNDSLDVS